MRSKTFYGETVPQALYQLDELLEDDFTPSLAILFSSVSLDFKTITDFLLSKGIKVIGCSTAGEIADTQVLEYGLAGMLLEADPQFFDIQLIECGSHSTREAARQMRIQAEQRFSNPAIIVVSSGLERDGEEIVRGIQQGFDTNIPLFGGLAADDLNMENTFVFADEKTSTDGLACLILDHDRIEVSGMAASGWEAVGVAKTVTKSDGNIIYTIDNEPALDVFKTYFGLPDDLDARKEVIDTLGAQYPLQVLRESGTHVLRAPMMGNVEDGSLIFAGGIPQGAKVKFSISPGLQIAAQTVVEIDHLKNISPQADALLLFSCKARHLALGPIVEEEISGMQDKWQVPLLGFFTYGEIGNLKTDVCDFHNETCSLVVLKERGL